MSSHRSPLRPLRIPRHRRGASGARDHGFSLIEVMIALLVFSIGVLGMAGLLVISVKTNHSAYLRTQASFIAQSMADRMRGNSRAVWAGTYTKTYPLGGAAGGACSSGSPCGSEALAQRDNQAFDQDLKNFLPNAAAKVSCARAAGAATPPDMLGRPPYDGLCTITVSWSEATLARDASTPPKQTFAWKFQP